jgi:CDP-4-dehydro-6-deoxyglucose reductase, E3
VRYRGGGFSHWLKEQARIGDRVAITGPYGDLAWRSRGSAAVIMLATGSGIAPIGAMLAQAFAHDPPRQSVRLYWGGRDAKDLYAAPLFRRRQAMHGSFVFVPVLSRRGTATGRASARVQEVALADASSLRDVDIYACGSPGMVADARALFLARSDMDPARFFSDAFERADPGAAAALATPRITLTIAGPDGVSRIEARVGETLLAALRKTGLPLLSVCGGHASCGTCRTAIAPLWSARLPAPGRVERNLLACLPDSRADHRLACQVTLTAGLDGLEIRPFA